jgi:hypothetical protein
LGRRPAAPHGDDPGAFALPRFTSTVGHSDFSHGIPGDFASRLIRPGTQPRRAGPYETSRGNACSFPAVPPAHTLLRPGAPSTSFAPVVQARHHLDLADRFAVLLLGYGPAIRRKPFRPRLAAGALSCASIPLDHLPPSSSCARRGITPAFGYGPRLGSVRLDFHQLGTRASPARSTAASDALPARPPLPGLRL